MGFDRKIKRSKFCHWHLSTLSHLQGYWKWTAWPQQWGRTTDKVETFFPWGTKQDMTIASARHPHHSCNSFQYGDLRSYPPEPHYTYLKKMWKLYYSMCTRPEKRIQNIKNHLQMYITRCLWKILHIKRPKRITNEELRNTTKRITYHK
jgi:hypothetical protein